MRYLYLFFDQQAPRPELHEAPLPRDTALLMGIYMTEAQGREHMRALQRQITSAIEHVRSETEALRSDLLEVIDRRTRRTQLR